MDNRTILEILLSIATVVLAVKNYLNGQRKDAISSSRDITEMQVQLNQITGMVRDIQKDMRNVTILSERVVTIETKLTEIYNRIGKLEEYEHGK